MVEEAHDAAHNQQIMGTPRIAARAAAPYGGDQRHDRPRRDRAPDRCPLRRGLRRGRADRPAGAGLDGYAR